VPVNSSGEQLSSKRYVIVLLRLIVDETGRLVQGEVVDVQGRSLGHFGGRRSLRRTPRAALASQDHKCPSNSH
jgi:hypothetical protein